MFCRLLMLLCVLVLSFSAALASGHIIVSTAGYDISSDKKDLPNFAEVEFLPVFLPTEEPGFVDLGLNIEHEGNSWRAMQFTQDKSLSVTAPAGRWLFGLQGDEWPAGTVDAFSELHAVRLESLEIDGRSIRVTPADIVTAADHSLAVYNVYPRFHLPGHHTITYVWRSRSAFYFRIPFDVLETTDPLGLDGRRVFVPGEILGSSLDGAMVLKYDVTVL